MYARFDPSGEVRSAAPTQYGADAARYGSYVPASSVTSPGPSAPRTGFGFYDRPSEPLTTPLYGAYESSTPNKRPTISRTGVSGMFDFHKGNENDSAQDYSRLRKLIDKRFAPYKLNVRRAEIFLRVQKKQLLAMQLYRELLIYVVFISIFFYLAMTVLPLSITNDQDDSLVGQAAYFNVPLINNADESFESVNNADDIWVYLKKFVAAPLAGTSSSNAQFRWYRKQIGAMRIRQVRGAGRTCALGGTGYTCFPAFADAGEERAPFGPGGRFQWQDGLSELRPSPKFMRDESYAFTYGTGGYVVDIPPAVDLDGTRAALEALEASGFVDEATRVLVVSINFVNPHTRSHIVVELMAEMPPTGKLLASVRVDTLNLHAFDSGWITALGIVFIVFTLGYVAHEFKQAYDMRVWKYFSDSWNFWDIVNLVLILWLIVPTLRYRSFCLHTLDAIEDPARPAGDFVHLDQGARLLRDVKQLAAFAILLCCVRIFKFFDLNPRLAILTNTVGRAVPDLVAYLVIFVIIFAGYAFFAWIVFGYRMEAFRSFYSSFAKLFGNLGGGLEIATLVDAAPRAGVFFYFSFVVIVSLILVNIFIAIVGKYYAEAGDEAIRSEEEFSKELSEEDRMSPYRKVRNLRVTVLLEDEDEEPSRDAEGRPIGGHHLPAGTILRLWISKRKGATATTPSPGAIDASLLRSTSSRNLPHVEASAAGNPVYVHFLPEVLQQDDKCKLVATDPTGQERVEARLRVDRVAASADGSWYMDLAALRDSVVSQGAVVQIPLSVQLWSLFAFYVSNPETVMKRRARKIFEEFGVEISSPVVPDEVLERSVVELSARNVTLTRQADETLKRRSFRLDELLRVVRELDTLGTKAGVRAFADNTQTAQLVREAVEIDALYRQAMAMGTEQANEVLRELQREAQLKVQGRAGVTLRLPGAAGPEAPALLPASSVRPAGSNKQAEEELKRQREVQLETYRGLYSRLVAAASQFDRRVHELWLSIRHTGTKTDAVLPETVIDSLRFDEVVDIVRAQAGTYAPQECTEVDYKREAVRFLALFPLACFEPLVQEYEKGRPYLPRPFDVDRIAHSSNDPARRLGARKLARADPSGEIARSVTSLSASMSSAPAARFGSPAAGAGDAGRVLQSLPDTITDLMAVVIHDKWAATKIAQGWRHGSGRTMPLHECLVPWGELRSVPNGNPEDDRGQALSVLRAVVALGYEFVEPAESVPVDAVLEPMKGNDSFHRSGSIPSHYWLMEVRELELPPAMRELVELLAKNAHDVWAKGRKAEGFTYGEVTDASRKQHSQLIPYECMTEDERSYDKGTAEVTIKMALACGWKIVPQRRERSWRERASVAFGIPAGFAGLLAPP